LVSVKSGLMLMVLLRVRFLGEINEIFSVLLDRIYLADAYFINCGSREVQPLLSCLKVRYNSNIDTVSGSTLKDAMRLQGKANTNYS